MTNCIVWDRSDGGITVEYPNYDRPGISPAICESECILKTGRRLAVEYGGRAFPHIVDTSSLPQDLYFSDGWIWGEGRITILMSRARVIHMAHIRRSRDAELVRLDAVYLRAIEMNDLLGIANASDHRIDLRDLPQNYSLEGYLTPEALKAAWPRILPVRE